MTEQKELNLLEYIGREDELQSKDGRQVLGLYKNLDSVLVVFKLANGEVIAGDRENNGRYSTEFACAHDIILKTKPKKKIAPFIYKSRNSIAFNANLKTKEEAELWCRQLNGELIKWLGDGELAVEVDDE